MNPFQIPVETLSAVSSGHVVSIVGSSDYDDIRRLFELVKSLKDSKVLLLTGFDKMMRRSVERFADKSDITLINEEPEFGDKAHLPKMIESCTLLVTVGMDSKIEHVERLVSQSPTVYSSI